MKVLLALLSILLLATCAEPPPLLQRILADGELRVVTRNSPDAYYLGSHGPEGPAYDLASQFAEHLGVPLRLYTVRTRDAAIEEVAAGRAHIAAAGLSTGIALPSGVQFGPGTSASGSTSCTGAARPGQPPSPTPVVDRSRSRQPARISGRWRTCG